MPLNTMYPKRKKKTQTEAIATEPAGTEDEVWQNEGGEASRKGKELATEQKKKRHHR